MYLCIYKCSSWQKQINERKDTDSMTVVYTFDYDILCLWIYVHDVHEEKFDTYLLVSKSESDMGRYVSPVMSWTLQIVLSINSNFFLENFESINTSSLAATFRFIWITTLLFCIAIYIMIYNVQCWIIFLFQAYLSYYSVLSKHLPNCLPIYYIYT